MNECELLPSSGIADLNAHARAAISTGSSSTICMNKAVTRLAQQA